MPSVQGMELCKVASESSVLAWLDKLRRRAIFGVAKPAFNAIWPRLTAISLVLLQVSCATTSKMDKPLPTEVIASPVSVPVMPPPAPEPPPPIMKTPSAPLAQEPAPRWMLVGKSYFRAYVLPRSMFGEWKVVGRADFDAKGDEDFLLVRKQELVMGIIATKRKKLGAVSHIFEVTAEVRVPSQYLESPFAQCFNKASQSNDVLAATSPNGVFPVWAIQPDGNGNIRTLESAELDDLKCKRFVRDARKTKHHGAK